MEKREKKKTWKYRAEEEMISGSVKMMEKKNTEGIIVRKGKGEKNE